MKRVIILFWIFMGFASCQTTSMNGEKTFAGFWKLHIIETQDSVTQQWVQSDWMKDGISYLHYGTDHNMSIHFTPSGFSSTNPLGQELDSLPLNALKMLASDYWYVGKYRVITDENMVEHHRIIHSDPNEWGKIVKRSYKFLGDTLVLSAKEFGLRLKWIRENDQTPDPREI